MNTRRFAMIFGLGAVLVLILVGMLSSASNPVQAYTGTAVAPTPTLDKVGVPRSRQYVPFKEHITDDQSQTQSGITTLTSSSEGIANGGFENGQDGSWEEYSTHGWDIIADTSTLPITPHSGSWAAWLGGHDDDISYISQTVTISTEVSTLSFWNWIASEDTCGYDFGWVSINGTNVQTIDLCEDNNTDGWVKRTADLSAYAGQTVTLQIRAETDGLLYSNYYIDDVAFESLSEVFLPLVLKIPPPPTSAPTLNGISNPDGARNFTVSWSAVNGATEYTLQQDNNTNFSNPTIAYSGVNTSTTVTVGDVGTYCYRVQAANISGGGPWSNIVCVVVTQEAIVPQPGYWSGGNVSFEVSSDSSTVEWFELDVYLVGCGTYTLRYTDMAITNGEFSKGEFTTPTSASGHCSWAIIACGSLWFGTTSWSATWIHY